MSELVDWRLAERVAAGFSGGEDAATSRAEPLGATALAGTCAEAAELVRGYARLEPGSPVPPPEPVDRPAWSRAVMVTLRGLAAELQGEADVDIALPGPLGGIARSVVGMAGGTEVGLAVGYASRRVLGQYDVALVGEDRPPRLLFVAPNLLATAAELETDLGGFVRWVALHETTHALQFAGAPWLRDHLGDLIRRLLAGAVAGVGLGELLKRIVADPRKALSTFLRGDVASALAGPERAPVLNRIQATMTVVEGHAEHVMDAAGTEFVPGVAELRRRLEARRASRGPLETIAARLLGLDLKLRQYRLGKAFCDEVVEREGIDALNRIWSEAKALPELSELEHPGDWLRRTQGIATAE